MLSKAVATEEKRLLAGRSSARLLVSTWKRAGGRFSKDARRTLKPGTLKAKVPVATPFVSLGVVACTARGLPGLDSTVQVREMPLTGRPLRSRTRTANVWRSPTTRVKERSVIGSKRAGTGVGGAGSSTFRKKETELVPSALASIRTKPGFMTVTFVYATPKLSVNRGFGERLTPPGELRIENVTGYCTTGSLARVRRTSSRTVLPTVTLREVAPTACIWMSCAPRGTVLNTQSPKAPNHSVFSVRLMIGSSCRLKPQFHAGNRRF
jgi:hypothetical protein